ncbi:MAG: hypothetical protein ACOCY8_02725, partial [Spirochaetota bacterium]
LLLLGGVVFYFGWIQIRIPAEGYGVIFSRTHGWETEVVAPGTFVWRWQRLIPTNLTLYVFEPEPHRTTVDLEGTLPSGSYIESILDEPADLDYTVRLVVQSRIRPAELPALARDTGLRPDDLPGFYDELDTRIVQLTTEATLSIVESQPQQITTGSSYSSIVEEVTSRLDRSLGEIEIVGVVAQVIKLPDMEIYRAAREMARDVLETRSEALQQAARETARTQAASDWTLERLERYGEILDRYPVLLDYFQVTDEIGGDPLELESFVPQPGQ